MTPCPPLISATDRLLLVNAHPGGDGRYVSGSSAKAPPAAPAGLSASTKKRHLSLAPPYQPFWSMNLQASIV